MKETLLPCTQGLANAGVPFGLALPRGPQKHKKSPKLGLFLFLDFCVKKGTALDFFLQGVLGSAIACCDLTVVHVNKRF
jgi:hypothetical protein